MKSREIKRVLSHSTGSDPYLTDVARRIESHRFLGAATQRCYLQLVSLIQLYMESLGHRPEEVAVLDWGTGKGHITYLLNRNGFRVTSCDVASAASDSAFGQGTPILTEQQYSVVPLTHEWALPFPDASFDVVVSFGVLEHVPNDLSSLQEIRRVLKPTGRFFFSFLPYWSSWTQRLARIRGNNYHDRLYRKRDVRKLAQSASFEVEYMWHGQLFPKNSMPASPKLEQIDRLLTWHTPLRYIATNLEGILRPI